MRSAGGVMGGVRDGFGASGGSALLPVPASPPPAPPAQGPGSGQAADGQESSGWQISNEVAALADQDSIAQSELESAAGSSGMHQGEMTAIIDQAVADVQSMGLATNTPEGKRALIAAIMQRLEETRGTAESGTGDASTHAASTAANVAGYNDVGGVPRGPSPLAGFGGAMPGMGGGMPGMGGGMGGGGMPGMGGLSALGQPLSALSGLASPAAQTVTKAASTKPGGGDRGLDTSGPGRADERGLQKYTKLMNRAISAAFPEIKEIGGVRQDALHWHPDGLALDIMIPNWDTPDGRQLGNEVVNFLVRNRTELGLDHMIWRQQMIQPDGSASMMGGRGNATQNHMDHVHAVSIGGGR
ncbi:MAG: hypothetical protein HYZ38_16075 [Mycobacterium sp.]|nr:hypothetical protein [Mycobacterium sp.]